MSWQSIVDGGMVGTDMIDQGAAFNPAARCMAATTGFKVTRVEYDDIYKTFTDQGPMWKVGITLGGVKYVGVSATPRLIHCRAGTRGLVAFRAKGCMCLATYKPPIAAPSAIFIMEALADDINNDVYHITVKVEDELLAKT
mmetsp:Transcript_41029/g.97216  ORF Transcript_41029/g.97216 Transcript_41029/m.97216 type:complete len:141 (-) Transcript_41029:189-611(-)